MKNNNENNEKVLARFHSLVDELSSEKRSSPFSGILSMTKLTKAVASASIRRCCITNKK